MITFSRSNFRYSTGFSPPAFRQVSVALLNCLPAITAWARLGEALSTHLVIVRSLTLALPAPPPVPTCIVPVWVAPQLQARTSTCSAKPSALASPFRSGPSNFRKHSTAMRWLLGWRSGAGGWNGLRGLGRRQSGDEPQDRGET